MIRRPLLQALFAVMGLAALSVAAEPAPFWPQRPVRIVVAAPPASSVDIVARVIAGGLRLKWGEVVRFAGLGAKSK